MGHEREQKQLKITRPSNMLQQYQTKQLRCSCYWR